MQVLWYTYKVVSVCLLVLCCCVNEKTTNRQNTPAFYCIKIGRKTTHIHSFAEQTNFFANS